MGSKHFKRTTGAVSMFTATRVMVFGVILALMIGIVPSQFVAEVLAQSAPADEAASAPAATDPVESVQASPEPAPSPTPSSAPAVAETPKQAPADPATTNLPKPPKEPLRRAPFAFPSVDPDNPESVALDQAQRTGKRVEIVSARTETETTYANPEGTLTTELASGPVRVKKGDGFVPVDTTLEVAADGIAPKAAQGDIKLSNGGAPGSELAAVGEPGKRVSFKWPQALPAPLLDGNTATYPDVAPGQDLVVKVSGTGFETFVVLKTRPERAPVISIPIGLQGLSLSKDDASGELKLSNPKGEIEATSSTPVMWSAARDPKVNEPTQVRTVDIQIEPVAGGSQIVLRPEFAFLSDPNTEFPVTIDPSANLASSLDTYVSSVAPTASFGADPELKVGRFIGAGSDTVFRSFIRFNTSTIKGRYVHTASLYLHQTDGYTCASASTWVEGAGAFSDTTTWNSQPSMDGNLWYSGSWSGGNAACPWASGWRTLDILGLARQWINTGGTTDNLALRAPSEVDQGGFRKFHSSNSAWPPAIAVEYDAQATYPAPGSATAVAGNGQATISWPAASITPESYGVALYRSTGPDQWTYEGLAAYPANNQFSTTFTNLTNGQGYIAQVASFGNGLWGQVVASNIFMPAVAPSAPTNVVATPLDSAAIVSWDPSTAGAGAAVGSYEVYAFNEQNQQLNRMVVNAPATSGTFSNLTTNNGVGLTNLQPVYFKVTAYNTSGQASPESAPSNVITPERPSDQVGLEDFYPYQDFDLGQGTAFANMASGNLVVQDVDYNVPGQGLNMRLSRTYNANADAAVGPFGKGWTLGVSEGEAIGGLLSAPLDLKQILTLLTGGGAMVFVDEDGTRHRFLKQGGVWQSPPGVNLTLTDLLGTYTLTRPDGVAYKMTAVGSSLRLTQIADRRGNFLNFVYSNDKLSTITDTVGRTLTFTQPGNLIESVNFTAGGDSLRTDFGYTGDRLISVTHAAGTPSAVTTEYTYSNEGLKTVKDVRGNSTTFTIVAAVPGIPAHLTTISDRAGQLWKFRYTGESYTGGTCVPNTPATVAVCLEDPEAKTSVWSTNAQGNLRSRRDAGDKTTAGADRFNTENFDWAGNRFTSHTDQAGNTTTYSYNPIGQISGSVSNGVDGTSFTSSFGFRYYPDPAKGIGDMDSAVTAAGTAEQRSWTFTYDDLGKGTLLTSKDPLDKVTTMTYYDRGMLKTVEDANHHTTTYGEVGVPDEGYDPSGQPRKITDALGKVTSFTFHYLGSQKTKVDRNNKTWTNDYDRRGILLSSTTPMGDTTSYCYDGNDNQSVVMPPRFSGTRTCSPGPVGTDGFSTKIAYDARDLVSSTITKSDGKLRRSTYVYFLDGQLKEINEPRSFSITDPAGSSGIVQKATYTRFANNRISAFIDEESHQTDVVYTPHGLPQVVTDPAGEAGRHTMNYTYNRLGQVKTAKESAITPLAQNDYDLHGDMTKQTNRRSYATEFTFDKMGRVLTVKDAKLKTTTRVYDDVGNLKSIKQPTGCAQQPCTDQFTTTTYEYTPRNEIDYEIDPADAAHYIDYVYDDEGYQTYRHDRRNGPSIDPPERTTQQVFRADGRPTESKATGTGLSEHRSVFGYDADGNTNLVNTYKDGSASVNVSSVTANYTSAGELDDWIETIYPPTGAAIAKTGAYDWGQDGLQDSNTVDGQTSPTIWFKDGNEKTFTPYSNWGSFNSTYWDNGALKQTLYPIYPGRTESTKLIPHYDAADRATSRVFTNTGGTKISAWESIGYDDNKNRTSETVTQLWPAGTGSVTPGPATYAYDALDRLTSFKHPFETATSAYLPDDAGNITSETGTTPATFTFTNNRLNRRTLSAINYFDYGYDHFGNQVTETETNLVLDATQFEQELIR